MNTIGGPSGADVSDDANDRVPCAL